MSGPVAQPDQHGRNVGQQQQPDVPAPFRPSCRAGMRTTRLTATVIIAIRLANTEPARCPRPCPAGHVVKMRAAWGRQKQLLPGQASSVLYCPMTKPPPILTTTLQSAWTNTHLQAEPQRQDHQRAEYDGQRAVEPTAEQVGPKSNRKPRRSWVVAGARRFGGVSGLSFSRHQPCSPKWTDLSSEPECADCRGCQSATRSGSWRDTRP